MTLYRNMDKDTLKREYSPSSCIDDIMVYINQYIEQSRIARKNLNQNLIKDIKYGSERRSHMDIFIPKGEKKLSPIHVFIHGGYWQELSKDESAFAAPNFIDHNIIFIALDYTLAPEANLFEIVEQVRKGIIYIIENAEKYGGDKNNITISGSSAGGHLVAEILSKDWQKYGYEKYPLKGALAISGIYDLEPLVHTYVNDPLKMTIDDAKTLSPMHHIPKETCPVIFTYGENETDEFKRQTHDYMKALEKNGLECSYINMPVFNHFDIVLELNKKDSPLFQAVLQQTKS